MNITRRTASQMMLGTLLTPLAASVARAQAPAPYEPTNDMIEAAKKEGSVVWYTSTDVAVSEAMAKHFEAKYPGIDVKVERSGAERVFQRISQEYGSNIRNADVIETSDAVHFVVFKRNGWLTPAVPADVAKNWPDQAKDADGQFAAYRAHCCVIAYNTRQVKAEEAPKSHADLLLPKWKGRMVKAHPGYSGTITTAMDALLPVLGWDFFEKLGQQRVMQVQSSTEPPKKLAQGERSVMADGNEYNVFMLKETNVPIEPVYATEGTPIAIGHSGLLKAAAHPNAGRLFYHFLYTPEAQQLISDVGGLRSFHPAVKEKDTRTPLSKIKLLYSDPVKLEPQVEDLKKKYEQFFGT